VIACEKKRECVSERVCSRGQSLNCTPRAIYLSSVQSDASDDSRRWINTRRLIANAYSFKGNLAAMLRLFGMQFEVRAQAWWMYAHVR
jgi:hypothetical protein